MHKINNNKNTFKIESQEMFSWNFSLFEQWLEAMLFTFKFSSLAENEQQPEEKNPSPKRQRME